MTLIENLIEVYYNDCLRYLNEFYLVGNIKDLEDRWSCIEYAHSIAKKKRLKQLFQKKSKYFPKYYQLSKEHICFKIVSDYYKLVGNIVQAHQEHNQKLLEKGYKVPGCAKKGCTWTYGQEKCACGAHKFAWYTDKVDWVNDIIIYDWYPVGRIKKI